MSNPSFALYEVAKKLVLDCGMSVIPCEGKRPAISQWSEYQLTRPHDGMLNLWFNSLGYEGLGVICGKVSHNLIVIDLDGDDAVTEFRATFPTLLDTYTVRSGSGHGQHLYFRVAKLPMTTRVKGFEVRGTGCYVVAPPSPHPSGGVYEVETRVPIARLDSIDDVVNWVKAKKSDPSIHTPPMAKPINPNRLDAYFTSALDGEVKKVQQSAQGTRNHTLFTASMRIGSLLHLGDHMTAYRQLHDSALVCGLETVEAHKTIESGLRIGMQNPKAV